MKRPVGWVQTGRMGAAKRNPSSLFEPVPHVSLGLLRVLRRQKTRLRVKDSLFETADLTIQSISRAASGFGLPIWGGVCGDQEHVAGVFNDRVQTSACAYHARRWRRNPAPAPPFLPPRAFSTGLPTCCVVDMWRFRIKRLRPSEDPPWVIGALYYLWKTASLFPFENENLLYRQCTQHLVSVGKLGRL